MVGDKLETDILGGKEAQLAATIWISGPDSPRPFEFHPDFTLASVLDLNRIFPLRKPTLPEVHDINSNSSDGSWYPLLYWHYHTIDCLTLNSTFQLYLHKYVLFIYFKDETWLQFFHSHARRLLYKKWYHYLFICWYSHFLFFLNHVTLFNEHMKHLIRICPPIRSFLTKAIAFYFVL